MRNELSCKLSSFEIPYTKISLSSVVFAISVIISFGFLAVIIYLFVIYPVYIVYFSNPLNPILLKTLEIILYINIGLGIFFPFLARIDYGESLYEFLKHNEWCLIKAYIIMIGGCIGFIVYFIIEQWILWFIKLQRIYNTEISTQV